MAPFKSEAQRRKFYAMAARDEIPESTVKEYESATKNKNLPERVSAKDKAKKHLAKKGAD